MARRTLKRSRTNQARVRNTKYHPAYARHLRFEPLEDRRMLSISTVPPFGQVSWIVGNEVTLLTVDAAGHKDIYYRPNTELGYVDPITGNLLTMGFYQGTDVVVVLDAAVTGNIGSMVGKKYSNGQVIATDGGNTVYHRDGSIMRSNGVWTYDAGATLESGGNWFWSNGASMIAGNVTHHPNGAVFSDSSGSIFYANGTNFINSATGQYQYPNAQVLRNAAGNYFYEGGATLESAGQLDYPNGATMVDANGTVHNQNGDISITPFSRYNSFTNSEDFTTLSGPDDSETTTAIKSNVAGSEGSYVVYQKLIYHNVPPAVTNIAVTAPDSGTLRFSWTSGGGSTAGYRVAMATGVSAPSDPTTGVDTANNFYVASGLTPGQKVTIRVWAKDASGQLSDAIDATGTAGVLLQSPQTGYEIESALATTFIQTYDSAAENVIFTVDKDNNYFVYYQPGDELGYVNIATGDRLYASSYEIPSTTNVIDDIVDVQLTETNIEDIPADAKYTNGSPMRNGETFYYDSGAVLRSAAGTWFYENGNVLESGTNTFWSGGTKMRSGLDSFYRTGVTLKSGASMSYENSVAFENNNTANALYGTGENLRVSGNLFYEGGSQLFASQIFHYITTGETMISSVGMPLRSGILQSTPFSQTTTNQNSDDYIYIGTDKIARYGINVRAGITQYMLGGTVDYNAINGDFNHDGNVDAADYVLYRHTAGASFNLAADGNANGTIDPADYDVWRSHFGQTFPVAGTGTAESLTEPPAEPGPVGLAPLSASSVDPTRQPPAPPGVSHATSLSNTDFVNLAPALIEATFIARITNVSNYVASPTAARLDILSPTPQNTDLALLNWLNTQPAAPAIQNDTTFDHTSTHPDSTTPTSPSATDDFDAAFTCLATAISNPLRLRASA